MFISRAKLILCCVCLIGGSFAGARHWGDFNCAQLSAESLSITTTIRLSCADNKASRSDQVCDASFRPTSLQARRLHHNYGKLRHCHILFPFRVIVQDPDDDNDDDDDTDLLVAPPVRRHRADPRHQVMETLFAGGRSGVLELAQASELPWDEIWPQTISLMSLQVRLQI